MQTQARRELVQKGKLNEKWGNIREALKQTEVTLMTVITVQIN